MFPNCICGWIALLQLVITWYKNRHAGEHIALWDIFKLSCFVLDVPVRNLLSNMAIFVPCDRQLQMVHSNSRRRVVNYVVHDGSKFWLCGWLPRVKGVEKKILLMWYQSPNQNLAIVILHSTSNYKYCLSSIFGFKDLFRQGLIT